MENYTVAVTIEARIDVKAKYPDDAIAKINDYISNYDFGRLSNIDWEVLKVTDESGSRVD